MPVNKNAFTRYRVIDATLRLHEFVKTKTLITIFQDRYDLIVGATTINKDIREMRDDGRLGFYAPIKKCNKEKAYYYPENVDEIFPAIELQEDELNALLFYTNTLSHYKNIGIFKDFTSAIDKVVDAVKIETSRQKVSKAIIVQPENFPKFKGSELIPEIITGFNTNNKFSFDHKKHTSETIKKHIVTPILLKEYDHLWYLISQVKETKEIRTFALDRIFNFEVINEKRDVIEDFDPEEYFNHSFGIFVPEDNVQDVILEFDSWRGRYLSSAPIHKSQKFIKEENDKIQFLFRIAPHHEFHAKILSYGKHVKVIAPISLREEIRNLLQETLNNY